MGRFSLFHATEAANNDDDDDDDNVSSPSSRPDDLVQDDDDNKYVVDSMDCDDDYHEDNNDMDDNRTIRSTLSSSFWGPLVTVTTHLPQPSQNDNDNDTVTSELTNHSWYSGIASLRARQQQRRGRRSSSVGEDAQEDDDDDDNDYEIIQRRNNNSHDQQLQSHSNQTNNGNAAALEQVPEQQYYHDHLTTPTGNRWSWWTRVILMALVAHLWATYGPVAPPQDSGHPTWEEFWIRELSGVYQSLWLLGYTVPKYVGQWIVLGISADVRALIHKYGDYRQEQLEWQQILRQNCSLTIPQTWRLEYQEEANVDSTSSYQIVGQSRAIRVATQALDAWKLQLQPNAAQQQPLLLFFAGSRGTGKVELAKQISRQLFSNCHSNDTDTLLFGGSRTSPVLKLHGRDFGSAAADSTSTTIENDDSEEDSDEGSEAQTPSSTNAAARLQLYETIIRHLQYHTPGAVIVIQHAEDLPSGLLADLVHDLSRPPASGTTMLEHYKHDASSLASRLQQACRQSLIILTSQVGSKTIASSIRTYGGVPNIPRLDLDLLLMHELDTTFLDPWDVTNNQAERSSLMSKRGSGQHSNSNQRQMKELGSKFHGVAPFFPLEQTSLEQILLQKVHQWNRRQQENSSSENIHNHPLLVTMTPQMVKVLVSPARIEYLTMVQRATQTSLMTFSSAGASVLQQGSPTTNLWQAAVQRCLVGLSPKAADNNKQVGDSTEKHHRLLLEYDDDTNQGVIFLCPVTGAGEDPEQHALTRVVASSCVEECRFPL